MTRHIDDAERIAALSYSEIERRAHEMRAEATAQMARAAAAWIAARFSALRAALLPGGRTA